MADGPRVTVVIPTRDRWQRLSGSLASALRQEEVGLEALVVDDGSTEPAPGGLAGLDDPRVRVVRHGSPQGVARARNTGIQRARGEWVAFLDDDDLWSPLKLRAQLDAAAAAGAGWVYAGAVVIDEAREHADGASQPPDPHELLEALLAWNVIPAGSSNVMASAGVLRDLGGFDEALAHLADWDLWIRLAAASPAAACPEVLVGYVAHSQNMHAGDLSEVLREFDYLAAKHREARRARRVELDGVRFSRWLAWGHRRAGRRLAASRVYLASAIEYRDVGNLRRAARALLGARPLLRKRPAGAGAPGWSEL